MDVHRRSIIAITTVLVLFAIGFLGWRSRETMAQTPRASTPDVRVPSFLQVNRTYVFRFQPGNVELYRVLAVQDGWIRAQTLSPDAPKGLVVWVNPARAMTIKEEP